MKLGWISENFFESYSLPLSRLSTKTQGIKNRKYLVFFMSFLNQILKVQILNVCGCFVAMQTTIRFVFFS